MPAFDLLKLCVWREARGEDETNRLGVIWCVLNRVARPGWWGHDLRTVILHPKQFSSFNEGDPNELRFPDLTDDTNADTVAYHEIGDLCVQASAGQGENPVGAATSYFDASIAPPKWAATMTLVLRHGRMSFYARTQDLPPPDALDTVVNE